MNEMLEVVQDREIHITLTDNAKEFLADQGFDPVYGARQVKRVLRKFIEDPLAEELLKNRFSDGSHIQVKQKGDNLSFVELKTESSEEGKSKEKSKKKTVNKPKEVNPEKSSK